MEPVRVFIVEDDPMVASINKRFTEKMAPFIVVGMSNNENDSLQLIKETKPDLVLLDIFLTHGNGLNILKRIRQRKIPADIILVTAAKDSSTIHEALRYGAVDYLIKPFDMERLQQALQSYLRLRNMMSKNSDLSQHELDKLNTPVQLTPENLPLVKPTPLPKGVHQLTLDQILSFLNKQAKSLSCLSIASELKMSKITVWRYLEYLLETGKVQVELEYGTLGRPTKLYKVNSGQL